MYKYQFMLDWKFIGKPFPAESLDAAVDIILKRHFKGYKPYIKYHICEELNREHAFITIPIPGRKKLTYVVEKTGLKTD